jgi:hypothetical protein
VALSIALVVGSLATLILLIDSPLPTLGSSHSPSGATSLPAGTCPANESVPAAAFDINSPAPAPDAALGTVVSVAYELRAVTLPAGVDPVTVQMPGVTAFFPLSSGTPLQVFLPAETFSVTAAGWISSGTHSKPVPASSSFAAGSVAQLSTQLLAVMATAPAGSFDLEVRWNWSVSSSDGATSSGPGTVPTWSGQFPSIFAPEPYVALDARGPAAETSGAIFQAEFSGAGAGWPFLLKLENASTGATLNRAYFNSTDDSGAPFVGSIQMAAGSVPLAPGSYLVHLHDQCGGILYSLPVEIVASGATSVAADVRST